MEPKVGRAVSPAPPEKREAMLEVALESLARSGRLRMRVQGTSMLPSITPGTEVLIRRITTEDLQSGDIVLIRMQDGVRLHRLVNRLAAGNSTLLVTRGDNRLEPDPPVRAEQLLGVLERIETRGPYGMLRRLRGLLRNRQSRCRGAA